MRSLTSRLLALAPGVRYGVVGLVVLGLCVTATYVGQSVLIARVLAEVFGGGNVGSVLPDVAGIVGLQLARAVLLATREARALEVSGVVKEAVRERLTVKLLDLGPGSLQRTRTGSVQSTTVDAVELLDPLVGRFLPQATASVLAAIAVTALMVVLDPLVATVIFACALVAPLASWKSSRLLKDRSDAWRNAYRGLYAENLDAVQGMATLKAFNVSRRRGAELHARADAFCRDSVRMMIAWCASAGVRELAIPIGTAAAVGIAALHRADGMLTNADLFTILLLTRECFRPLRDLEEAYHAGYQAVPASRSIFELLDTQPEVVVQPPSAPAESTALQSPPGLEFVEVTFTYNERTERALNDFSLSVAPGERVAVVGRSGAGKTTIVRVLTTLLKPDGGTLEVVGLDVVNDAAKLRHRIGLAGQYAAVDENLTGLENLVMVDRLYGASRADAKLRGAELLERFDLVDAGDRPTSTYSGGMRRRLDLAAALVGKPDVLFLDEPTSGLDPRSRINLWETIEGLVAEGTTVLLTTQYLDEADRLADSITVIDHGLVIAQGTSDELKDRVGGERLEVRLEHAAQADAAVQALAPMTDETPTARDSVLSAAVRNRSGAIVEAVRRLGDAGVGVDDITLRRPTLDDVFLSLTGHAAEDAEAGKEEAE